MESSRPKHRFFVEGLSAGEVTLAEAEAHHALHVLRLKAGEPVEVFDGAGRFAVGAIVRAKRNEVVVAVEAVVGPAARPRPDIHVAFAPPKGKRLDWLLEKLAELGAASLRPIECERSVVHVKKDHHGPARWRTILCSAVRQSKQTWLPAILPALPAGDAMQGATGQGLIAHGGPDVPAIGEVLDPAAESVTIFIGPEGGWTEAELAHAESVGCRSARLGESVLRVETAAVAVCAAVIALARR